MKQFLRSAGAAILLACALSISVCAMELVLPEVTVGEAYSYELPAVAGGCSAMVSGALPEGMTVSASEDGEGQLHIVLQGTPTQPGAWAFSVTVSDAEGAELTYFHASLAVLGMAAPVDSPPPGTTAPPESVYTTWIEILTLPLRDSYAPGERIDPAGLTLRLWQSDGSSRDTDTGYTLSPETAVAPGAQTVSVTCEGCTAGFVVEVRAQSELTPPAITRQPEGALVNYGDPVTLYAEATAPAGTLQWQWYRGESEDKSLFVPAGTTPELPLDTHRAGKSYYFARVNCTDGVQNVQTDSRVVLVRVMAEKPRIVTQPGDCSVQTGEACALDVEAALTGSGTLSYLWYGAEKPDMDAMRPLDRGGETEARLTLDTSRPGVGYYCVLVSGNENGEITSVFSEIAAVQIRGAEETASPPGAGETATPQPEAPATRPPEVTPGGNAPAPTERALPAALLPVALLLLAALAAGAGWRLWKKKRDGR